MMLPRSLLGLPPQSVQPLTPVSEVSEPPESPSPYLDVGEEPVPIDEDGILDEDEVEIPPAAVPFFRLFAYATPFDWFLMVIATTAAAAHGAALPIYLHFFGKIINMLDQQDSTSSEQFDELCQVNILVF